MQVSLMTELFRSETYLLTVSEAGLEFSRSGETRRIPFSALKQVRLEGRDGTGTRFSMETSAGVLGGRFETPADFARFAAQLRSFCGGAVDVCLELA